LGIQERKSRFIACIADIGAAGKKSQEDIAENSRKKDNR
jgi:hypothetical protein